MPSNPVSPVVPAPATTGSAALHVVTQAEAGQRVDAVLRNAAGVSRSTTLAWFTARRVLVNERRTEKGAVVSPGDVICVLPAPDSAEERPLPVVDIRHETADLLVCYKPAGVATIAQASSSLPSLSTALLQAFPQLESVGYAPGEAGLLQRLDNDTTGLLVAAKTAASFASLLAGMRDGALSKTYLALVSERPAQAEGQVSLPLGPHPKNRRKVTVTRDARDGFPALTSYRVVAEGDHACLLELQVASAYRHQIRVHLAAIGCPLAGDSLYGGKPLPGLSRHALHASRLTWAGNALVPAFDVKAPLPTDLTQVAASCGLHVAGF
jgi:23S rRNA pseudouridine1911/1915/1917 synthase